MRQGATPQGWLRVLLRMPILVYRLHLGWLLGHRFLLLTHVGRKSGLHHRTVLEVVRYTKRSRTCIVASGWGEQAHWLQNIMAHPAVEVTLGLRTHQARAQRIPRGEAVQVFREYAHQHPWAMKYLARFLLGRPSQGLADDFIWLAEHVPLVELRLANGAPCVS
jgi:deazaflavin-dependent oxidoreductase (nitroreductase family)